MKFSAVTALLFIVTGILFSLPAVDHIIIQGIGANTGHALNEIFWTYGLSHSGIEMIVFGFIFMLQSTMNESMKSPTAFPLAVMGMFFAFLFYYAVNIPIMDDYRLILDFSNQYFFSGSSEQKFEQLSSFHGESRFISLKLAIVAMKFFTGSVNIKSLIILSCCCLPILFIFFYRNIHPDVSRKILGVGIALLIFQFGYYDAITWASGAFAYQVTTTLVCASLILVRKNSLMHQFFSMACAVMAAMTCGNGLLAFPLAILFLVIQKNRKLVAGWMILSAIFILSYFYGSPAVFANNSSSSLLKIMIFSCCFTGSAFQYLYGLYLPFIAGALLWILFGVLTATKYYRENYFIYAVLMFVLLSSLITAYFRSDQVLLESISNRYQFFSVLGICTAVIAMAESVFILRRQKFIRYAFICCLAYHLLSGIFFFPEVPVRKQKLENLMADILNNRPFVPVVPVSNTGSEVIVKESIRKKIYFP